MHMDTLTHAHVHAPYMHHQHTRVERTGEQASKRPHCSNIDSCLVEVSTITICKELVCLDLITFNACITKSKTVEDDTNIILYTVGDSFMCTKPL